MELGTFALMPFWLRLVILYLFAGLALSLYQELRDGGKGVAEALGGVLWAAVSTPVALIKSLFGASKAAAIAVALVLGGSAVACAATDSCRSGLCPLLQILEGPDCKVILKRPANESGQAADVGITVEVQEPLKTAAKSRDRFIRRAAKAAAKATRK